MVLPPPPLFPLHPPEKLPRQPHENPKTNDLRCEPSDHNIYPRLPQAILIPPRRSRDGSASGLENEAENVAGDKDLCVGCGLEA
jgi:hypothetical protein